LRERELGIHGLVLRRRLRLWLVAFLYVPLYYRVWKQRLLRPLDFGHSKLAYQSTDMNPIAPTPELITVESWNVAVPPVLLTTLRIEPWLLSTEVVHRVADASGSESRWEGRITIPPACDSDGYTSQKSLCFSLRSRPWGTIPQPLSLVLDDIPDARPLRARMWLNRNPSAGNPLLLVYVIPPIPEIGISQPIMMTVTEIPSAVESSELEPRTTACICTQSGLCHRHQCEKTAQWRNLCFTRADYFQAWENGSGPGQFVEPPPQPPRPTEPGIFQKAWNLATAAAAFIADGCQTVDAAEYSRRLAICDVCDQREGDRCRACGCHLLLKARARAMECPVKKWGAQLPQSNLPTTGSAPNPEGPPPSRSQEDPNVVATSQSSGLPHSRQITDPSRTVNAAIGMTTSRSITNSDQRATPVGRSNPVIPCGRGHQRQPVNCSRSVAGSAIPHKHRRFLTESLEKTLLQTTLDAEAVASDDSPADDSPELARQFAVSTGKQPPSTRDSISPSNFQVKIHRNEP
jgi:hypothetical protein